MALLGISAVIITKNEERNIGRCIQSLKGVVDEIIVVDSGSKDETISICKQHDVRVLETEWKGYSATKNEGNALSQYSHILSIDADECLSDKLQKELLEEKEKGFSSDAYDLPILTNYCGKWIYHCGWYPARKIRLWRKELGNWGGHIHEAIQLPSDSTIGRFKGDLLHYSYYTLEDHLKQIDHYTTMMAENNVKLGKKGNGLKLVFSPIVKFLQSYLIRLGFLDGPKGFQVCWYSAYATYVKYKKTLALLKA